MPSDQEQAAEKIFRNLLATYTRIIGPDHEDVLMTRQGDAGLAALQRVAAFRRTGADANNWRTQLTDVHIGECLVALKRYSAAEPLLRKAVATLEATRGPTHDNTQAGYRALRDLYAATGRLEEADRYAAKLQL